MAYVPREFPAKHSSHVSKLYDYSLQIEDVKPDLLSKVITEVGEINLNVVQIPCLHPMDVELANRIHKEAISQFNDHSNQVEIKNTICPRLDCGKKVTHLSRFFDRDNCIQKVLKILNELKKLVDERKKGAFDLNELSRFCYILKRAVQYPCKHYFTHREDSNYAVLLHKSPKCRETYCYNDKDRFCVPHFPLRKLSDCIQTLFNSLKVTKVKHLPLPHATIPLQLQESRPTNIIDDKNEENKVPEQKEPEKITEPVEAIPAQTLAVVYIDPPSKSLEELISEFDNKEVTVSQKILDLLLEPLAENHWELLEKFSRRLVALQEYEFMTAFFSRLKTAYEHAASKQIVTAVMCAIAATLAKQIEVEGHENPHENRARIAHSLFLLRVAQEHGYIPFCRKNFRYAIDNIVKTPYCLTSLTKDSVNNLEAIYNEFPELMDTLLGVSGSSTTYANEFANWLKNHRESLASRDPNFSNCSKLVKNYLPALIALDHLRLNGQPVHLFYTWVLDNIQNGTLPLSQYSPLLRRAVATRLFKFSELGPSVLDIKLLEHQNFLNSVFVDPENRFELFFPWFLRCLEVARTPHELEQEHLSQLHTLKVSLEYESFKLDKTTASEEIFRNWIEFNLLSNSKEALDEVSKLLIISIGKIDPSIVNHSIVDFLSRSRHLQQKIPFSIIEKLFSSLEKDLFSGDSFRVKNFWLGQSLFKDVIPESERHLLINILKTEP